MGRDAKAPRAHVPQVLGDTAAPTVPEGIDTAHRLATTAAGLPSPTAKGGFVVRFLLPDGSDALVPLRGLPENVEVREAALDRTRRAAHPS
eukprot:7182751-Prymnesium_polylepis.2